MLKKELKSNPYYQLFKNPKLYLKNLLTRTCYIGLFTLVICLLVKLLNFESYTFPPTIHSLVGFIIGLLLVFRTNTAYDRWWDGRKIIGDLACEISLICIHLNLINKKSGDVNTSDRIKLIKGKLSDLILVLGGYLMSDRSIRQTKLIGEIQDNLIEEILFNMSYIENQDNKVMVTNSSISKLLYYSSQLSRIKNTPIPIAYVYHIKVSMLLYLVTLPFGVFHYLGLWSIPMVMLMYFIIAGVEIISSEIENPFAGDPNDLPTEILFNNMLETLEKESK